MSDRGMLHSAEVRWFFKGGMPSQLEAWLLGGQPAALAVEKLPEVRTDRYLIFPGCESIGVKERQRKFEIKAIRGSAEVVTYPGGFSGRMETWEKWSYEGPAAAQWVAALRSEPAGWVEIEKSRWSRKYSLDAGKVEEVHLEKAHPDEGCGIELTKVTARGSSWWTFGLEAFGDQPNVRLNLYRVANHFFTINPPSFKLETVGSISYPVWMSCLLAT